MGIEFEQVVRYGPSGLGDVRFNVNKDDEVSSVKVIDENGTVYPIAPDNVDPTVVQESRKGVYYQLSLDESILQAIRPWDGAHPVRFGGFTRRGEAEEPEPYLKRGGPRTRTHASGKVSHYNVPDQYRFTSVLEIVGGDFKGYTMIYWLPYVVERGDGAVVKFKSRSGAALDRIKNFLTMTGWDFQEDIPFSDNILPYLERQLLKLADDNVFMASVERGWPTKLDRLPTGTKFE